MNLRITAYLLGKLAVACAMALCIPLAVAVLYNEENISAFLWAIAWSAGTGVLLVIGGHRVKDTLTVREGIAVTTLGFNKLSGYDSLCGRRLLIRFGRYCGDYFRLFRYGGYGY